METPARRVSVCTYTTVCLVVLFAAPAIADSGGGEMVLPSDEITPEQRQAIWAELDRNWATLVAEGKLPVSPRGGSPQLEFPLRTVNGLNVNGYFGISNYVDQDVNFPGFLLEWNCGARTYDTSGGYNHQGIDYFTWPFPFIWLDNDQVEVIAAATGTILGKDDGSSDRNCAFNADPWNAVYVQHADGSIAWYGHLKNGSLTTKLVGESVDAGEYLGVLASSGNSTGPHLHFELYDRNGFLQEPHYLPGQCNNMNSVSWWADQESYRESKINFLTVGSSAPVVSTCPNQESPNIGVNFVRGETHYLTAYYRDQLPTQTTEFTVYAPDDTVRDSWTQTNAGPFSAAWWWWSGIFLATDAFGDYRWEVVYEGQTYEAEFRLNRLSQIVGAVELTVGKSGSDVELSWTADCLGNGTDYGVYEGQIGDWTSHDQVVPCSTGGLTTQTVVPTHTNSYFLVVPSDPTYEGSYGRNSEGDERAASTAPCRALQSAGLCPP